MANESDSPPLLFTRRLGSLVPANKAAEAALRVVEGACRVRITGVRRNQRRRAYYWIVLDVAAQALQDNHDIPMDAELLHETLKRKLRLGTEITLPSGEVIFKPQSTSDKAMTEPERARWTDRVSNVLATWLGVPVETLLDEARARDAGIFGSE